MQTPTSSTCAAILLALAACEPLPLQPSPDAPYASTSPSDAPARVDPWRQMSSEAMWAYAAQSDTSFTFAVKQPGAARGIYRGRWLVDPATWQGALKALQMQPGIRVLQVDESSPSVLLNAGSAAVLDHLRQLPFVDYVEPAVLTSSATSTVGGASSSTEGSGARFSSSSGSGDPNYGYYIDAGGNWIPNIFTGMRIPEAWQRSTGAGVTIGLLDTGVDLDQPDLAHWARHKVYYPDV